MIVFMRENMIVKVQPRPPEVIAEELLRESDLDEAAELATELARSLEEQKQKQKLAKPA